MAVVIKLCNKMVDPAATACSLKSNGNADSELSLLAEALLLWYVWYSMVRQTGN